MIRPLSSGSTPAFRSVLVAVQNQSHCRVLPEAPLRRFFSTQPIVQGPHGAYQEEFEFALRNPQAFWTRNAEQIEWFRKPTKILEEHPKHLYHWFSDGLVNLSYNCLDVHVKAGRGSQVALYYDSPVTGGFKQQFTYSELLDQVAKFAHVLQNELNVKVGDRVVIYMPMIPQTVVALLACSRIGAIHSVVFGGFAALELSHRIADCQPRVVITASVGVEPTHMVPYKPLLDEALAMSPHKVDHTVIVHRHNIAQQHECPMGEIDLDYDELMANAHPVDAVPLRGDHLAHILYTSGTTGAPKGIVRETAGWAVALKYSMNAFYNTGPGETMWTASDVGWIVGQAYTVYAPLLNGCSTVLYEGKPVGTPDAGAFWRVMEEYNVKTFFTAPTAFRAIKQADPKAEFAQKYDLSSLQALFLAGEHSDPDTLDYCRKALGKYGAVADAIDHWWQTELGWPGVGNAIGLGRKTIRPGACTGPVPGHVARVLGEDGHELPPRKLGTMVLNYPLPPGTFSTLYKNDERFVQEYLTKFPGYYDSADAAFMDEDGYIHIVGRVDDIIITAGHRLSTGALEEILMDHPEVADCAVFPVKNSLKGELPVGLVVTNKECQLKEDQLRRELIQMVRESMGPVAAFKKVASVPALPKTRSGKILRGTMSKIANGEEYTITPTIEDATVFDRLDPAIRQLVS